MYLGPYAQKFADRPAFVMAGSGEQLSFGELDARSNQLAHLLRGQGLQRLGHYAVFMENNSRYIEACMAGERSGLYYTCINGYLQADELTYILNNSESTVLITSADKLAVARQALADCPKVRLCLVVGGGAALPASAGAARLQDYATALAPCPATPIADEALGTAMLYSSGTTGRPKGILRPLPDNPPSEPLPLFHFLNKLWQCEEGMVYLSPAPLYHSAPLANVSLALRNGGTVIIMEHFDPEAYLALIAKYQVTHTQLVPTMFSRLLKLPPEARALADLSSLKIAVHAAAPCPAQVKEAMIDWWGPIIHEEAARTLAAQTLSDATLGTDTSARVQSIANKILSRPFRAEELGVVVASLNDLTAIYQQQPDEAKKLIAIGESKPEPSLNASDLAAWTMLVNELMNLDEVLTK